MESSQGSGFDIHVPTRMPQSPGARTDTFRRQGFDSGNRTNLFARILKEGQHGPITQGYYSIPDHWICRGRRIPFGVYGKDPTGEIAMILEPNRVFAEDGQDAHTGPPPIFLKKDSRSEFLYYLDENLDEIVADSRMSPSDKAEIYYYLAYRRLKSAYKSPGRVVVAGIKQLIALMNEQILNDKETFKQVFSLIQDNVCKTPEHPGCTIMHALNVGILSTFFVTKVLKHLSREALEKISLGYFFHNIGMMRLPAKVVDFTGPLTDTVWPLIRQHPRWGLDMMKDAKSDTREMAHVIMDHHERLDGNGYPGSLKGSDIHFFVKVCAIMDAFDAMISQRPYRKALPLVEALKQIKQKIPHEYDAGIFSKLILIFLDSELI